MACDSMEGASFCVAPRLHRQRFRAILYSQRSHTPTQIAHKELMEIGVYGVLVARRSSSWVPGTKRGGSPEIFCCILFYLGTRTSGQSISHMHHMHGFTLKWLPVARLADRDAMKVLLFQALLLDGGSGAETPCFFELKFI